MDNPRPDEEQILKVQKYDTLGKRPPVEILIPEKKSARIKNLLERGFTGTIAEAQTKAVEPEQASPGTTPLEDMDDEQFWKEFEEQDSSKTPDIFPPTFKEEQPAAGAAAGRVADKLEAAQNYSELDEAIVNATKSRSLSSGMKGLLTSFRAMISYPKKQDEAQTVEPAPQMPEPESVS